MDIRLFNTAEYMCSKLTDKYNNQHDIIEHLQLKQDLAFLPCPICGSDEIWEISDGREAWNRDGMKISRCRDCGVGYTNPRLADQEAIYLQWSQEKVTNEAWRLRQRQYYHVEHRLEELQRFASGKRLLEVGCGAGIFLEFAAKQGLHVTGIDLCPHCAHILKSEFDLDVRSGTISSTDLQPGSFDIIIMWDVLEHVTDPVQVLKEAAQVAVPNAVLALRVPNFLAYPAFWGWWRKSLYRLLGKKPAPLDTVTHIIHYPQQTLEKIVRDAGFRILKYDLGQECQDGEMTKVHRVRWAGFFLFRSLWLRLTGRVTTGQLVIYARKLQ